MVEKAVIIVSYGSFKRSVIDSVLAIMADLVLNGVEPQLIQIYNPGSETAISVNGKSIKLEDIDSYEEIRDRVFEAVIGREIGVIVKKLAEAAM